MSEKPLYDASDQLTVQEGGTAHQLEDLLPLLLICYLNRVYFAA